MVALALTYVSLAEGNWRQLYAGYLFINPSRYFEMKSLDCQMRQWLGIMPSRQSENCCSYFRTGHGSRYLNKLNTTNDATDIKWAVSFPIATDEKSNFCYFLIKYTLYIALDCSGSRVLSLNEQLNTKSPDHFQTPSFTRKHCNLWKLSCLVCLSPAKASSKYIWIWIIAQFASGHVTQILRKWS